MRCIDPTILKVVRALGLQWLFEIRAKGKEGIGRAFFCMVVDRRIIILHAFIKKSQKTPVKELAIARKRLADVKRQDER